MKLLEHEGKELFRAYGILTPKYALLDRQDTPIDLNLPLVLKSQVPSGDRMKKGGIALIENEADLRPCLAQLFSHPIDGAIPVSILIEERIAFAQEIYVSISYSTETRTPVLSLNKKGGTAVHDAKIIPIDPLLGVDDTFIRGALDLAEMSENKEMYQVIAALWKLFREEHLVLAEINPLFITKDHIAIAGDAKLVVDDAYSSERAFVSLGGDIAVIASGGGASMLNIDILMREGGRPANYVEYSGNPPAHLVEELTVKVLSQPGVKAAWVIGGTANFTDIYETISGLAAGLRKLVPKPSYPIVVRRDGPRQKEAKEMLLAFADETKMNIEVYGPEMSMSGSAKRLVALMNVHESR